MAVEHWHETGGGGRRGAIRAARHMAWAALTVVLASLSQAVPAQDSDPDRRAAAMERAMTDAERISLVWGYMPAPSRLGPAPTPPHVAVAAGYVPPIERLGFRGLYETDASLGVTNPNMLRPGDVATALPASLALAASFDPDLAQAAGAMIGEEARAKGFNVLLAGGVNLTRDWFGGRNFEYLGEDPLLAGTMAGRSIRGIQSRGVVSTVKHFVLNAQETLRHSLDVRMAEPALRESDLLAFQIAIEQGRPGSVMCAYNRLNGAYGCSNPWLLDRVLRRDWRYPGWVMSDWGATHGVSDMVAGLDQESGAQLDKEVWFGASLARAIASGEVPRAALSTSVRRILRSVFAVGADAAAAPGPVDLAAHAAVARRVAEEGIVLLTNDGLLPLADRRMRVLVVGRFADRGVWSGGGSSQVIPVGGPAARVPYGGSPFLAVNGAQVIVPSSPLAHLAKALPSATFEFDTGYVPELAAARARRADLVIAFANKWQVESVDAASLDLPDAQDALIGAVASANRNTLVVLETGNPVAMPWLGKVRAVVQAWYSGQEGGAAITRVLTGAVNPSGRLPMTFPRGVEQAPRAAVPGLGLPDDGRSFPVTYAEGSDVGYRWYADRQRTPLFAFGHGLSYTAFRHAPLQIGDGRRVVVRATTANVGRVAGADVAQVYLVSRAGKPLRRLVGFARVSLAPGEERTIALTIDPRLLADWQGSGWRMPAGDYAFAFGRSAIDLDAPVTVRLSGRRWRD